MTDEVTYGIAAIGILMVIFALRSMGKKRSNQVHSRDNARDHIDRARQKQGVRDELEALMVDIHRMAKDLGAQLDAKVVRIEKANREAQERIAQLQALQQTLAQPSAVDPPPTEQAGLTTPATSEPSEPTDQGDTAVPADPVAAEVYKLADQGKGPQDIAQALGEHVGKVELILALRTQ